MKFSNCKFLLSLFVFFTVNGFSMSDPLVSSFNDLINNSIKMNDLDCVVHRQFIPANVSERLSKYIEESLKKFGKNEPLLFNHIDLQTVQNYPRTVDFPYSDEIDKRFNSVVEKIYNFTTYLGRFCEPDANDVVEIINEIYNQFEGLDIDSMKKVVEEVNKKKEDIKKFVQSYNEFSNKPIRENFIKSYREYLGTN